MTYKYKTERIKICCLWCDKPLGEIEYLSECCRWRTSETKPLCEECYREFVIMEEALTKIRCLDDKRHEEFEKMKKQNNG